MSSTIAKRAPIPALPAVLLLVYVCGLKTELVVARGGAGLGDTLAAIVTELAPAGFFLAACCSLRAYARLPGRILAGVAIALFGWAALLARGMLLKSGGDMDWRTIAYAFSNLDEALPVVAAELGAADILLFCVPLVLLVLTWRRPIAPGPRPGLAFAVLGLAGLGAGLLVDPVSAPHPELARSLVGRLLPIGGASTTRVENAATNNLLPEPGEIGAAWARRPADGPRPNVVVFMLESVRASATTPYNSALPTTPFLAELARRSVVFDGVRCQMGSTAKSMLSVFSGYPAEMHIDHSEPGRLPAPGIPHHLRALGYRSAFFYPSVDYHSAQQLLSRELGFDEYFSGERMILENAELEHWRMSLSAEPGERPRVFELENELGFEDRITARIMLDWLAKDPGKPFFLGVLNISTHHPYRNPPSWKRREFELADRPPLEESFRDYLNTVSYLDQVLREFFAGLEARKLLDNTVVILVGDHGEAFGEHGPKGHGNGLNDESLEIPLLVHGPEALVGPPRRVGGLWQNLDVAPTIADVFGVPGQRVARSPLLGRSLFATPSPTRKIYLSSWLDSRYLGYVAGADKLVFDYRYERFERFDLAVDPLERENIAGLLTPAERSALKDELYGVKWAIEAFYRAGDRNEAAAMRRKALPDFATDLDVRIADSLRLVGATVQARTRMNDYFAVDIGFEVLADSERDLDLVLRLRQAERSSKATSVRDPNRLPVIEWRRGERILVPQLVHFTPHIGNPGEVTVELALVDAETGKPTPSGFVELGRVFVQSNRER